ncbi:hypothetical protein RF55_10509 [Lasius niger]|uniref:Uncharacterized protein n=1 Tax=Lasius niger TaxID=67767 RepID=A0A0J7KHW4_LASNI|nr:hypothetical protein RF55_10509 [Lasius niger]
MSRVWARTGQPDQDGKRKWISVSDNTAILTWLQQAVLLQLGESPFWVDWGLPVIGFLSQGIYPDLYMQKTKERFQPYFLNVNINRNIPDNPEDQIAYTVTAIPYPGQTLAGAEYSQAPRAG